MKINEIINEGILDRLVKGAKGAVQGYTQSRDTRVNAQATAGASKIAARAWGKYKQNLERINNYKPVPDALLLKRLIPWIDNNLLGSYSLANGGQDLNRVVKDESPKIIKNPEQTEKSFNQILTVAGKVALDPTAGDPGGGGGGGIDTNTAPFKVINNIATAGDMKLNLGDPKQLAIYNRIRDEVAKGDIKV